MDGRALGNNVNFENTRGDLMKILIVMSGFFPGQKYGGPPVSVDNLCTLMEDQDFYIVTRNHDLGENTAYSDIQPGWNNCNNCRVLYLSDKEYGYKNFGRIIEKVKPDVIYLQGLFQKCILPCLVLAKKNNVPVMLAPRGELCAGAFKKKYKKIPYIAFLKLFGLLKNVYFQSTSDEETLAIEHFLNVKSEKVFLLNNVPSIPKSKNFCTKKQPGKASFIFLSRIVPKKNLLSAINYMAGIHGTVQFDIYGAIEDKSYWEKCKNQIDQLPLNIKVEYKGLINHNQVHDTFRRYDAFLFPTYSENFGHVIAEALMVGCPVIISDQTPWTDVTKAEAGWAIPLNKKEEFKKCIETVINWTDKDSIKIYQNAIKYIEEKSQLKKLKDEYNRCLNRIIL